LRGFAFRLFAFGILAIDTLVQTSRSPYANVVKEWFKLPGGRMLTRQEFPPHFLATRKSQ